MFTTKPCPHVPLLPFLWIFQGGQLQNPTALYLLFCDSVWELHYGFCSFIHCLSRKINPRYLICCWHSWTELLYVPLSVGQDIKDGGWNTHAVITICWWQVTSFTNPKRLFGNTDRIVSPQSATALTCLQVKGRLLGLLCCWTSKINIPFPSLLCFCLELIALK